MKNSTSLISLRNTKKLTNMQKKFFEILMQTALTVGLFWTILRLTPKSALHTVLYYTVYYTYSFPNLSFPPFKKNLGPE